MGLKLWATKLKGYKHELPKINLKLFIWILLFNPFHFTLLWSPSIYSSITLANVANYVQPVLKHNLLFHKYLLITIIFTIFKYSSIWANNNRERKLHQTSRFLMTWAPENWGQLLIECLTEKKMSARRNTEGLRSQHPFWENI